MDLCKITSQFMCCYPLMKINWSALKNILWNEQEKFLEQTIFHPIIVRYPLNRKYQIAFLKYVINELEGQCIEIHDKFYESYCMFINQPYQSDWSYKHYKIHGDNNLLVTLKESTKVISDGTTGLVSWQASLALSEWVLHNKEIFECKEILELGSGAGLLGFIIAQFCKPKKIFLSDCHHLVLNLLKENISLNFPDRIFTEKTEFAYLSKSEDSVLGILNLPWENLDECNLSKYICPDLIVAADIVYDEALFEPLLSAIQKIFLLNEKCQLILACTVRNEKTFEIFLKLLDEKEFRTLDLINCSQEIFSWDDTTPIKLFSITKSLNCS